MRRRHLYWLLGAAALLVVAALLGTWDEEGGLGADSEVQPAPRFPRGFREGEWGRAKRRRRRLPTPSAGQGAGARPSVGESLADEPEPESTERDPMLAALAGAAPTGSLMVFEANVLRHTPVGERLLACMSPQARDGMAELRSSYGVDPLQHLDRVAVGDGMLLLSGHFDDANWESIFKDHAMQAYGEHGRLYQPPPPEPSAEGLPAFDSPGPPRVAGVWRNELLLLGRDEAQVQAALDQLEGRAEPRPALLDENQTYGEAYGVLAVEDALELFPDDQQELAERFRQAARSIELHVDARRDVAIVAEVSGDTGELLEELARALGGVLALGRLKARADGADKLVELLEHARIHQQTGDAFTLELALPLELIERHLGRCAQLDEPDGAGAPADRASGEPASPEAPPD